MPTLLLWHGFRFYFWSKENKEPVHVHIERGDAAGKIWLIPEIKVAYLRGFTTAEERLILDIIGERAPEFIQRWNEHFKQ